MIQWDTIISLENALTRFVTEQLDESLKNIVDIEYTKEIEFATQRLIDNLESKRIEVVSKVCTEIKLKVWLDHPREIININIRL